MLSRYCGQFLKSRVVPLSFWADKMAMEVAKHPFDEYRNYFVEEDPRKYYVHRLSRRNACSTRISSRDISPTASIMSTSAKSTRSP